MDVSAEVRDADGSILSGQTITWETSDPSILHIPFPGKVQALLGLGTATVTAKIAALGVSADLMVRVIQRVLVSGVSIVGGYATVPVGNSRVLTAELGTLNGLPLVDPNRTIVWRVSDSALADLSTSGPLTAVLRSKAPGVLFAEAQIEGQGTWSGTSIEIVASAPRLDVEPRSAMCYEGGTFSITGAPRDYDGQLATIPLTFTSSATNVATVTPVSASEARITCAADGDATVTVSAGPGGASYPVGVRVFGPARRTLSVQIHNYLSVQMLVWIEGDNVVLVVPGRELTGAFPGLSTDQLEPLLRWKVDPQQPPEVPIVGDFSGFSGSRQLTRPSSSQQLTTDLVNGGDGKSYYIVRLTNASPIALRPRLMVGETVALDCRCSIPASSAVVLFGFASIESNSEIRIYEAGADPATSPFHHITPTPEFRTGLVEARVTTPP